MFSGPGCGPVLAFDTVRSRVSAALAGHGKWGGGVLKAQRRRAQGLAQQMDRYPFNSRWVRDTVRRRGLALWFLLLSGPTLYGYLSRNPLLFFDARLYLEATRTWMAGGDPWSTSYLGITYAAPPPTLLALAPFALLPDPVAWMVLGGLCIAGAIASVRMLSLPWWWLLFPPIVLGALSGNIQLLLLPLLLRGAGWAAGFLKVYALVPVAILGQWRQLLIFSVLLAATAPFLPWGTYLSRFAEINAALAEQSHYGLTTLQSLILLVPAVGAMWVVGRERSAWLAVPALWPSQQWYYATLALPARSQVVAFIIAIPISASGTVALFALALLTLWQSRKLRDVERRKPLLNGPTAEDRAT